METYQHSARVLEDSGEYRNTISTHHTGPSLHGLQGRSLYLTALRSHSKEIRGTGFSDCTMQSSALPVLSLH